MKKISNLVDMKRTPPEVSDSPAMPMGSDYPYGLCISLCEDELEKLGFQQDELKVGDMVHLHAMATVTSTASNESTTGASFRAELQITHINALEDETEEDDIEEAKMSSTAKISKLYK